MSTSHSLPVVIIGAGLSGLAAALELEAKGRSCWIIEKASQVGGKIQTDFVEGKYYLDHGFQVLLPAYPELKKLLPRLNLELKKFNAGALINVKGKIYKVADPLMVPESIFSTALGSYGTFKDKMLVLKLKHFVSRQDSNDLLRMNSGTSLEFLRHFGFSEKMIANFWSPFFSGVFLEDQLLTRSGFLLFLYQMFAAEPVVVPKKGVGALAQGMLKLLKSSEILLNSEVVSQDGSSVTLSNGKRIMGSAVISPPKENPPWGSVTTLYFAAPKSPWSGPWLYLSSKQNKTLVNHVAVMTEVSKDYCLTTEALVSVSVIKGSLTASDRAQVLQDLEFLFGEETRSWKLIKIYEIAKALPLSLKSGVDFQETPSQQFALLRGIRSAHVV